MDLEERAALLAADAPCRRCGVKVLSAGSALGIVTGVYRAVALNANVPFTLCGGCGIDLREFLDPALRQDEMFQESAGVLRRGWAS